MEISPSRHMVQKISLTKMDLYFIPIIRGFITKEVKNGRNYLIFAEGTRSKNGNHPQEFKGGSFKAAMKAKCPIVPVALIDTYKAFDTGSVAPLTVQVHFLEPIPYEEYKEMKSTEIAAEVKRRIEKNIQQSGGWD